MSLNAKPVNFSLFTDFICNLHTGWFLTWSAQVCLVTSSSVSCCCVFFRIFWISLWSGKETVIGIPWHCPWRNPKIRWKTSMLLFLDTPNFLPLVSFCLSVFCQLSWHTHQCLKFWSKHILINIVDYHVNKQKWISSLNVCKHFLYFLGGHKIC